VDPRRDVDVYLREIESRGLKLKGILLSHVHADFVSGHLELHERSGATICVSSAAPVTYPHLPCDDGEYLVLTDRYAMKALHTPGHTPGCITWLIVDRTNGDRPLDAFTGDTLFVVRHYPFSESRLIVYIIYYFIGKLWSP
jgi:glyoxylase-like metal-dependent hydrolase (beta-lactamase superfamily II)